MVQKKIYKKKEKNKIESKHWQGNNIKHVSIEELLSTFTNVLRSARIYSPYERIYKNYDGIIFPEIYKLAHAVQTGSGLQYVIIFKGNKTCISI